MRRQFIHVSSTLAAVAGLLLAAGARAGDADSFLPDAPANPDTPPASPANGREAPEPIRQPAFKFPSGVFFSGDIICTFSILVGREGRPTEIKADEACPERLVVSARDSILGWRWAPPDEPFIYMYKLRFRSHMTGGLKTSYFRTIARAYVEMPARAEHCDIGFVMFADGKLTNLTTNDKAQCLALPIGKLAMPAGRARRLPARHTCILDLKVTEERVTTFRADPSCPSVLVRHLKSRLSQWHWIAPRRSSRPYRLTVNWQRHQR